MIFLKQQQQQHEIEVGLYNSANQKYGNWKVKCVQTEVQDY